MKTGPCDGCGATMLWAITVNGKPQPFNPEPIDTDPGTGDRVLIKRHGDAPLALRDTDLGDGIRIAAKRHGLAFYRPHHATCPDRDKFKGPRRAPKAPADEEVPL
jgi:hypothetical protein